MIYTIFGIAGILGIYLLGTWSGLFVAALIVANRDREEVEEDFEEELETRSRDSEPKE